MSIKASRTVTKNGTQLVTVNIPDSKTTTVAVFLKVGSEFEKKGEYGTAHFLEHMLFKSGREITGRELVRELESYGAHTNAFTDRGVTAFYIKGPMQHTRRYIEILGEVTTHAEMKEEQFMKEKGVILDELAMYQDDPGHVAWMNARKALFGESAGARSIGGEIEEVENLTLETLKGFYKKHYHSQNAVVILAADKVQDYKKDLKKHYQFDGVEKNKSKRFKSSFSKASVGYHIHEKDAQQIHIVCMLPAIGRHHPDYMPLSMLGTVLGGGMSSRLFEQLREEKGISYYATAHTDAQMTYGVFSLGLGTSLQKAPHALAALFEILSDCKQKGNITKEELKRSQSYRIGNILMGLESSDDWLAFYAHQYAQGHEKIKTPKQKISDIKKVTTEDIQRVAKKYFKSDKMVISLVGKNIQRNTLPLIEF